MSIETPKHFCPVPWTEVHSGTSGKIVPCCTLASGYTQKISSIDNKENWDFYNTPIFTELRDAFLKGEKHPACVKCWDNESAGLTSRRTRAIKKYEEKINDIVENQSTHCKSPQYVDIRLSAKCNLRCKMCDPNSSTSIKAHLDKLKRKGISNTYTNRPWDDFDISDFISSYIIKNDSINDINIAGGEPFIEKKVKALLLSLIENNRHKECSIGIITNLTIIDNELIEILLQFKKVQFHCSIDGTGKEFEYQREPHKWVNCKDNIEELIRLTKNHSHAKVFFTPCVSHLNVRSLPSLIYYLYSLDLKELVVNLTPVHEPSYLHYTLIPINYRLQIAEELNNALDSNPLRMNKNNYDHWKKFVLSLQAESNIRHSDIKLHLQDAVTSWNQGKVLKWRDLYPWADILL
jgi:MoaA/NifB/PqqE/SkfB family radical SAM enzyme